MQERQTAAPRGMLNGDNDEGGPKMEGGDGPRQADYVDLEVAQPTAMAMLTIALQ